jgi:hypothetical protein
MTIARDEHFATLLSRGSYIVTKGMNQSWDIAGYDAVDLK